MSNFRFVSSERMQDIAKACVDAEKRIHDDPRAACFHARRALEVMVHWLYRHDNSLQLPYDQNLGALLHHAGFKRTLPEKVWQKTRLIQKAGNIAVHETTPVLVNHAMHVVKELHHIAYWLVRSFAPTSDNASVVWQPAKVPKVQTAEPEVSPKALQALEEKLNQEQAKALKEQQEKDAVNAELQALKAELARIKAQSEQQPDTHDYDEVTTRAYLIDLELALAGWNLQGADDKEYEVVGMPKDAQNKTGKGYVDYVLWGDDGKPLAVVEAKRSTKDAHAGKQQAKLYADCIENMHGIRPLIFYTNGYDTHLWDDANYPERKVAGFYKKDELASLITRRTSRKALVDVEINQDIAGRPYQMRAIGNIFKEFEQAQRKALLVMATGTGKTRTAIALIDALQRAGWVKRALFLADRVSLVNQAVKAFKDNLPETSPVNLVTEKDGQGRVYACTYPTMLNLIDQKDSNNGKVSRFGVGHFDIIVIDEAHRSVYQKYKAIFDYFDSLLVGLTATPREEIDKNTYSLFDIEDGVPTDAYELAEAVKQGYLVPPTVQQIDMNFPRTGISYDELSAEDQENWENTDWGENVTANETDIQASAVNNWLFNNSTADEMLKHLLTYGHKVAAGDRLAKTIIFARNHDHAVFIAQRFDANYPQHKGKFARVIDNYETYAQSLIDDFSKPESNPHIAISVDMLDTGIDVPEVANLVFFKPVYSKIKFWQMIGRGTRLCPDLFAPEQDKTDFRIFDFCGNFAFFSENPEGFSSSGGASLSSQLFAQRVHLLTGIQQVADNSIDINSSIDNSLDAIGLKKSLTQLLHSQVSAMNSENFMVRMHLEAVEKFQDKKAWNKLDEEAQHTLITQVAHLPSELPTDDLQSRLFDLTAIKLQIALLEKDTSTFARLSKKVMQIAMLLEEKDSIAQVKKQLAYLQAVQTQEFWQGMSLAELEKLRLTLRELVPFLDKKKRKVVYTDFEDNIVEVTDGVGIDLPTMAGVQYEKKVKAYLKNHENHIAIARLRANKPLTEQDIRGLQQALESIGEEDGESLLTSLLEKHHAPSLAYLVRSMVGLDRVAVQTLFEAFLKDTTLSPNQIRFIELVIDQLTARGVMTAEALYEPPFSDINSGGPDVVFAGKENVIDAVFGKIQQMYDMVV